MITKSATTDNEVNKLTNKFKVPKLNTFEKRHNTHNNPPWYRAAVSNTLLSNCTLHITAKANTIKS
jgi:hypothetical protein